MNPFNNRNKILTFVLTLSFAPVLFFQNCSQNKFSQSLKAPEDLTGQCVGTECSKCPTDQILVSGVCSAVICDAFSTKDGANKCSVKNGLVGSLHYFNLTYKADGSVANPPSFSYEVDRYLKEATKSSRVMFLSALNIATVGFDKGFFYDGKVLTNDQGNKITEHFALDLYSSLKARSAEEAGQYQLVLLSDDGSVLDIAQDQFFDAAKHPTAYSYSKFVDNDGGHQPRVACGTKALSVRSDQAVPIRLKYFQGPRFHISISLFWKKINSGQPLKSGDYCGKDIDAEAELAGDGFVKIPQANYIAPQVF